MMKKNIVSIIFYIFLQSSLFAQPIINVKTNKFDFGSINEGFYYDAEFIIENIGNEDLIISDIQSGCGCIKTFFSKEKIPPGVSRRVVLAYNSQGRMGVFTKSATIRSNSTTNSDLALTVSGNVNNNMPNSVSFVYRKVPEFKYTHKEQSVFEDIIQTYNSVKPIVQPVVDYIGTHVKEAVVEALANDNTNTNSNTNSTSTSNTIISTNNCNVKFESNSSRKLYVSLEKDCFNCSIQNAEIIIYSKDNETLESYKKKDESYIDESFYISNYEYPLTVYINYKIYKALGTDKYITATVKMANPTSKLIIKPTD